MSTNQRGRAEEAAEGRGGAETQDGAKVMIMMKIMMKMMMMMIMMMEIRQRSKDEEAERRKVNYTNKIHYLIV